MMLRTPDSHCHTTLCHCLQPSPHLFYPMLSQQEFNLNPARQTGTGLRHTSLGYRSTTNVTLSSVRYCAASPTVWEGMFAVCTPKADSSESR